jgi:hypothetical protein
MSRLTRLSINFYRLSLRAYPARFQQEYGPHMLQLFEDQCRRTDGNGGLLKLWPVILRDLFLTIPTEHLDCILPTRNLYGPALMLGGALLSTGFMLSNGSPEGISAAFSSFYLAVSSLFLAIGLLGFRANYRNRLGWTGRALLVAAALGSMIALIGDLSLAITGMDWLWAVRMIGIVLLFLFIALFGLVCLIRKPLPRYNGVPLLIGIWIPTGGLIGAIYYNATGSGLGAGSPLTTGILATICMGFLILGNMLRTDPGKTDLIRHIS